MTVVVSIFSCTKEQPSQEIPPLQPAITPPHGNLIPYTFTAFSQETKTTLDGGTVVWNDTDQIQVFYDGGSSTSTAIDISEDGRFATFTVPLPEIMEAATPLYAVYPATASASLVGNTLNLVVPSMQAGTFEDANIVVAATTAESQEFCFKQVLSFVSFVVSAGNPKEITRALFKDLRNTAIAGTIPITFSGGEAIPGTASSTATEINLSAVQAGENYIALLPGASLSSIGLKLGTSSAWLTPIASDTDHTAEQGHIKPLGTVDTKVGDAYYVKSNGTGKGTSWADAGGVSFLNTLTNTSSSWKQLSTAFKLNGYEIRLAEGTYEVELGFTLSDASSFSLKGGYESDGTENSAKLATFTGNDSHRIVWVSSNQNANITFQNILFTHGTISGDNGGAMKILGGSHTFNKCSFTRNVVSGSTYKGGAIYMNPGTSYTTKSITIIDCTFGGEGTANDVKNEGSDYGSALCLFNCVATVTGSKFYNNSFPSANQYSDKLNGAAVYLGDRMEASFDDCEFKWNYGGAFRLSGATALSGRKVTLNNCFFWKNTCKYWGGGIHVDSPIPLFLNKCRFNGNKASGRGAHLSQSGSTSFVGINNCSFYRGTNFNEDDTADKSDVWMSGISVVANSSFVGSNTKVGSGAPLVMRYANNFNGSVLVNSVIYQEASGSGFWGSPRLSSSNSSDRLNGYYNLMRNVFGTTSLYNSTEDKKQGTTFTDIGGSATESTVTIDYTYTSGVPNPTLTSVANAIRYTSGTTSRGATFEAFYNWLDTIGALTEDGYGNTRSDANNRPGALVK